MIRIFKNPALALALYGALLASPSEAAGEKIVGFARVDKNVYRGGRPKTAEQMQLLASKGIRTIINLQGFALTIFRGERKEVILEAEANATRSGMRYLKLPFHTIR